MTQILRGDVKQNLFVGIRIGVMVTRLLASGRGRNAAIAAFRAAIELNSMYTIAHVDLAIAAGIRGNTGEVVTELPISD